jgi:mycothiol synthase
MTTAHAPTALRLRPYAGEPDLAAIVRIQNAEAEADGLPERVGLDVLGVHFARPNEHFQPRRDVTIAEIDGSPVAISERTWVETTDGFREYRTDGAVHPDWRRRGIGSALLAHGIDRLRELASEHETDRPRLLGSWTADGQPGDAALLAGAGFEPARWFFDMTRPSLDDVPDVPLPPGFELRPVTPELARPVWHADVDAFRDHWGGFDGSDERLERWLASPSTDLRLWVVAFDGDEVAGGVLSSIDAEENALMGLRRGWLSSVFTRRAWRRRGLARALIARSLAVLRERGMTSAALGVDGANATGALGLYEGMGFVVTHRSTAWRKAFQP